MAATPRPGRPEGSVPDDPDQHSGPHNPVEIERRRRLREALDDPVFTAGAGTLDPGDALGGSPPVTPYSGCLYLAVRAKCAADPLRDPEARIGICDLYPVPATVPAEENPCAYQVVSFVAAGSPLVLRHWICVELLRGSPDLSPRALKRTLDEHWRVVPLEVSGVRLAQLVGDPALPGGERQLRRESRHHDTRRGIAWSRIRETLDRGAALATMQGDPDGPEDTRRLLVFTVPGLALTLAERLRWGEPMRFAEFADAPGPNLDGCRPPGSRWQRRRAIVTEMRDVVALVRETAEAAAAIVRVALLALLLLSGPAALVLVLELLRGN